METLYISTTDTNGMADKFESWINKNHPEIKTVIEIGGPQTVLINDDGDVINQDFWVDFCNDIHD
jgi:hypothetical protein